MEAHSALSPRSSFGAVLLGPALARGTRLPERSLMLTGVTWTVAVSVYAHGLTAWPGAARYADRYAHH